MSVRSEEAGKWGRRLAGSAPAALRTRRRRPSPRGTRRTRFAAVTGLHPTPTPLFLQRPASRRCSRRRGGVSVGGEPVHRVPSEGRVRVSAAVRELGVAMGIRGSKQARGEAAGDDGSERAKAPSPVRPQALKRPSRAGAAGHPWHDLVSTRCRQARKLCARARARRRVLAACSDKSGERPSHRHAHFSIPARMQQTRGRALVKASPTSSTPSSRCRRAASANTSSTKRPA